MKFGTIEVIGYRQHTRTKGGYDDEQTSSSISIAANPRMTQAANRVHTDEGDRAAVIHDETVSATLH